MQTTTNLLMIKPVAFGLNSQTIESNSFQNKKASQIDVQKKALKEFDDFVSILRGNQINVLVIEDSFTPHTPDSIFPNNWISFHEDGKIFLYPMQAENRRLERRLDLIKEIKKQFKVTKIEDLSAFENVGIYLEGTGSLVLDRDFHLAYACLSTRTQDEALIEFSKRSSYNVIRFNAVDQNGMPIYHTNVMMCVAEKFVVICLESIISEDEKTLLISTIKQTNKEIIPITLTQMNQFAGNMLAVKNTANQSFLVMSESAYLALTEDQIQSISKYSAIIYSSLKTVEENGGGSARCMIAEIHLPMR
jgi:hypothetical protein